MKGKDLSVPGLPGNLFVVATPIGNLDDITLRALKALKQVSLIACEDTRKTRKLLNHFSIRTPTTSYHKFNESTRSISLVRKMLDGADLALVTDAGTPCFSDPGFLLVSKALGAGIKVIPVPGPTAFVAALSASGLPTERIHFEGFLPGRKNARRNRIRKFSSLEETIVLYESPHRIRPALEDLREILGNRESVLAREITKLHEEWIHGTLEQVRSLLPDPVRGELTLVIRGQNRTGSNRELPTDEILLEEIGRSPAGSGSQAVRAAAHRLGISRREAYRRWLLLTNRKTTGDRDRSK